MLTVCMQNIADMPDKEALMSFSTLDCNHGEQDGNVCVCDEGWASSGLDSKDQEHWCDVRDSTGIPVDTGPIRLTYIQELSAIIVSSHTTWLCSKCNNILVCIPYNSKNA